MNKSLKNFTPKNRHWLLLTFLLSLSAAALLFVPYIALNGGIFYYFGDFNVQEIPFYQLIHGMVRSGELGWNHLTDLGTDTLSSYSFYLMGSPFFWMTIPFPNEFVPYLIGPLLILKFACAASSAYIFLQRYVRFKAWAVAGGLLYAFSGFSIYNVFFFHFHEPMIVFPLLLAALDAFLYDGRRGIFAVAVFGACAVNYYFFVGQAVFVIMYYLMITLTKTCPFRLKSFLALAAEVLIGFAAAAFILLPSVLGLLGNPRIDSYPNGWNALAHDRSQRYWLSVLAFFFPADIPAMPTFTPESNCKWASVAGWLPLFGMTGVIAYLQLKKRDWLKKMILLLILFALIPVLNSAFQLFNISIFYTRWYYMLVLMMALATVRAAEDRHSDWKRAVIWSSCVTAGAALLIGLMPDITEETEDTAEKVAVGVENDLPRFWIYVLVALISILAFVLIYKKFRRSSRAFALASISGILAVSLCSSWFIIGYGVMSSSSTFQIRNYILNSRDKVEIDDLETERSDFYECVDNTAMFWKVQSINCFQSSVSTSIMQFYNAMGITRDVASRPDFSAYGLRALLSCKYYFDYDGDNDDPENDEAFIDKLGKTKMPCWTKLKNTNHFDVYQNDCYIPMGFAYESYITQEEFERVNKINRTEAILYAMVLTKEQMREYSDITGYSENKYKALYGAHPKSFSSIADNYRYGITEYEKACDKLAADSCTDFEYTKTGFEAEYDNLGESKLMFFSVPYSDGFSATVNGEKVKIEKVNYGFMAVRVPAYTKSKIVFEYETPGFAAGVKISLASLAVFGVYLALTLIIRRKLKRKETENSDVIRR